MTRVVIALAAGLFMGANASPAAGPPSFQEIEEALTCQCGCGLTVHSCNHLECPSAIPLRREIREQLALGLDGGAVLAHFEKKYGEKILSSPTARGFNLTAWTMPFVLLAAGAALVAVTLRRWRRGGGRPPVDGPPPPPVGEISAHERTLERELERFDG